MAYSVPTSTIAGQTVWYLAQLPSYEEFTSLVESSNFTERIPSFLSDSLATSEVEATFEGLNTYYTRLFAKTLDELPQGSDVYHYLTLKADLRRLEDTVYAREQAFDPETMKDALLRELEACYHPERFRAAIKERAADLEASEEVFEFLSVLEEIYLELGIENALSSVYLTRVITAEVNRHNAMVAIRRSRRGQTKATIYPRLIRDARLPGRVLFETLQFGDTLGEVGHLLGLSPETLSETQVETHLLHKEIEALNSAKYEGVEAERIAQYLEVVYHFVSNVKLALAGHRFGLPFEELEARLVNYTA